MNRRNTIMITALREMCAGKKITALDYAKRFDTTRLGARIYDLGKYGAFIFGGSEILTEVCTDKYGERYVKYYIPKDKRTAAKQLLKQLEK